MKGVMFGAVVAAGTMAGAQTVNFDWTQLLFEYVLDEGSPDRLGTVTASNIAPSFGSLIAGTTPAVYLGDEGYMVSIAMDIVSRTDMGGGRIMAEAANGSLVIADGDGDTLSFSFAGSWERRPGNADTSFLTSDTGTGVFTAGGDGVFSGTVFGSVDLGSLLDFGSLVLDSFSGEFSSSAPGNLGFFSSGFSTTNFGIDGSFFDVVPTPGTAALAVIGAVALVRRRR